jgi:hypothetical protein
LDGRETCASARTKGFEEGSVCEVRGSLQNGFALSGDCAANKSHTFREPQTNPYRCAAVSVEGFIQQLAVSYVARGYLYYVAGSIPETADPVIVDEKLITKYEISDSKWVRARRKKRGQANVQYLRFNRFFILLATPGFHRFWAEERQIRDIRRWPVRFAGYSVGFRLGKDMKWHVSVRIDPVEFRLIKRCFIRIAATTSFDELLSRICGLRFAPYAPVRDQLRTLLRTINRHRRAGGLEPLPWSILPQGRAVVLPFG